MSISRLIHGIQLKRKRRRAIARACERAEPTAIVDFLAAYPDQKEFIESSAMRECDTGAVWYALMLGLGLAMTPSPRGLIVLQQLLKLGTSRGHSVPWNRLSGDQIRVIVDYLSSQQALAELRLLLPFLSGKQYEALRLEHTHPAFLDLLKGLLDLKKPINKMVAELMQAVTREVEALAPNARLSSSNPTLIRCQRASEMILSEGRVKDALGLLTLLSLGDADIAESTLKEIAACLPHLLHDELVRAANLVRRYPSQEWVPTLKQVWLDLERELRADPKQPLPESIDAFLDAAANAVASALGACAACDADYNNFAGDLELLREEEKVIEQYNSAVTEYHDLKKQYKSPALERAKREDIVARLKVLEAQLESQSHDLHQEFLSELSPAYLLLQFLRRVHIYPTSARQGAALGLHLLRTHGHLDKKTKDQMFKALREAIDAEADRRFCERHVRLLPGRGVLELTETLRDGLRWMEEVVEGEYAPAADAAPNAKLCDEYPQLREIVTLMCKALPDAFGFLQRCPLRLMPLDYHKRLLGNYLTTGGALIFWTRYTPPKDVGTVHMRYLGVEDRSTPNSMGIYYRLFRHPVLALPVIYHESLHYGGLTGKSEQGITNETEVLLREITFARGLVAQLAPAEDQELPAFEESLVREIQAADLDGLRRQLLCNFRDNVTLAEINDNVGELYGDQLSEQEVEARWDSQSVGENLGIELQNRLLEWDETITWPLLGSAKASAATKHYRELLRRRWTSWHRVSPEERDQILGSEPCASQSLAWENYCRRPHVLRCLLPNVPYDWHDVLRLIVTKFDLRPKNQSNTKEGRRDPFPVAPSSHGDSSMERTPYVKDRGAKVGRNDPCPCGSGKKYRKCHGAV